MLSFGRAAWKKKACLQLSGSLGNMSGNGNWIWRSRCCWNWETQVLSRRCRCRGILELWKEGRLLSLSSDTLRKVLCFPSDSLPALSFQVLCAESWGAWFSYFFLSLNTERRDQVIRGGERGFNGAFLCILEAGSSYLTQSSPGLLPELPKCRGSRRAPTHSGVQHASRLCLLHSDWVVSNHLPALNRELSSCLKIKIKMSGNEAQR